MPPTLRKQAEWDSGGIDPHQPVLDAQGHLLVANGGVLRNLADAKYDLQRMESALVRIDTRTGRIAQRWVLDDPRLICATSPGARPPQPMPRTPPVQTLCSSNLQAGGAKKAAANIAVEKYQSLDMVNVYGIKGKGGFHQQRRRHRACAWNF